MPWPRHTTRARFWSSLVRETPKQTDSREGVRAKVRSALSLLLTLAAAFAALWVTGIGCPVRFVTGVACPGCGLTRAWIAALHFNLHAALAYHPLFWLVPVVFVLAALHARVESVPAHRVTKALLAVAAAAFLALWLMRLLDPADAGLLFGGSAPAGVPQDIIYAAKPACLGFIESLSGR